jgi:hypothetical protein
VLNVLVSKVHLVRARRGRRSPERPESGGRRYLIHTCDIRERDDHTRKTLFQAALDVISQVRAQQITNLPNHCETGGTVQLTPPSGELF